MQETEIELPPAATVTQNQPDLVTIDASATPVVAGTNVDELPTPIPPADLADIDSSDDNETTATISTNATQQPPPLKTDNGTGAALGTVTERLCCDVPMDPHTDIDPPRSHHLVGMDSRPVGSPPQPLSRTRSPAELNDVTSITRSENETPPIAAAAQIQPNLVNIDPSATPLVVGTNDDELPTPTPPTDLAESQLTENQVNCQRMPTTRSNKHTTSSADVPMVVTTIVVNTTTTTSNTAGLGTIVDATSPSYATPPDIPGAHGITTIAPSVSKANSTLPTTVLAGNVPQTNIGTSPGNAPILNPAPGMVPPASSAQPHHMDKLFQRIQIM
ncbi:mucin-2-like [Chrysoperla carnea]|uniref:mucin-2-like n=1 Tax=Chrysoperla carnea TaxID=189513 RepID=UPI001D081CB0|nr:mucin-2-like [Chrysoperla carnea]